MKNLHIGVVSLPQMLFSSVALPIEMLVAGHEIARAKDKKNPKLTITYFGDQRTTNGISLNNCQTIPEKWDVDILLLPAIWRNPLPVIQSQSAIIKSLLSAHKQGIPIACVGSSVFLLAESGLLNGRTATTHWAYAKMMQQRYPNIDITRKHFITHSNGIYCCASINALADLTIHLIGEFMGADCARLVERNFSHEIRRAYEQQSFVEGQDNPVSDELVATIVSVAKDSVRDAWSLSEAAHRFNVSEKTIQRRFKQAMKCSYREWLEELRISEAKDLLNNTNLMISEVADYIGFNSEGYFIRRFKNHLGLTPNAYRETTRGKQFE